MASYDQRNWFRVPTQFVANQLVINYTPEKDEISYAYFTPYDYARQLTLINQVQQFEQCQYTLLGNTPDNNNIDLLTAGQPGVGKKTICENSLVGENNELETGRRHPIFPPN